MYAKCPHCSSVELRKSRLRWFDVPFVTVLIRPLRCRLCGRRSYHFNPRIEPAYERSRSAGSGGR
jgi:C4-type Zn-finger protein